MKTIILHGILEKYFCKTFKSNPRDIKDLFKFLYCNFQNYDCKMSVVQKYCSGIAVVLDDEFIFDCEIDDFEKKFFAASKIELIPCSYFSAFLGIAAGFLIKFVLVVAISVGISMLITNLMKSKDPKQTKTASYIFGNKENISERNSPVFLNYGRLKIGSNIINASILNFDITSSDNIQIFARSFIDIEKSNITAQ